MEDPPTFVDDVALYELALRKRAGAREVGGGDPALAALHSQIRERRARRSPAGPARPGVALPRGAEDDATPPPTEAAPEREVADQVAAAGSPGRILAIESHGSTVRVFRVGRPVGLSFRPGQYLKVGVLGGKCEDFSVASAPHEPHLAFAIELRPGGKVTPALFALGAGDAVDLSSSAKGKLQLDATARHHLMVATVTGIAPLRSMVVDALRTGTSASFTILHGASYATELPFHDELLALAADDERVRYVPTVSRPDEAANRSWSGATGRVDPLARMAAGGLDPTTTHVYAVGNAGMIKAVVRDLGGAGFEVSTESYGG